MLHARNISKLYRLYRRPADRIWELMALGRRRLHQEFWALRDINLTVDQGETLGVIGPNGGGKSTLLQILCGILQPSTGRVSRRGRVAALLELGAGFNPEFSGRENIYLNGEIMGLSRERIDAAMPEIERFAGIGEFLERPVKTYSSGMHVRLAFAAAIHVEPDILVIDEALAVGDAVFANRCVRKLEQLQTAGVTIIFVSHDLGLVKQLCRRAVFLMDGRIQADGDAADVVNLYVGKVLERQKAFEAETRQRRSEPGGDLKFSHRHGDGVGEVVGVELLRDDGSATNAVLSGETVRLRVRTTFHGWQENPMVGILVRTRNGMEVLGTNTRIEGRPIGPCGPGDIVEVEFRFACQLTAQEYTLTVATQHPDGHSHDWLDDAISFQVLDSRRLAGVVNGEPEITIRRITV